MKLESSCQKTEIPLSVQFPLYALFNKTIRGIQAKLSDIF